MTRRTIGVSERPPLLQTIPLSLQHLFAMFGATVLVPVLFHINPATVLLFNGIGTLLYLFICKGKSLFLHPCFKVLIGNFFAFGCKQRPVNFHEPAILRKHFYSVFLIIFFFCFW